MSSNIQLVSVIFGIMLARTTLIFLYILVAAATGVYVPGTPGGPWTQQELLAVKSKLFSLFRRALAPQVLRLSFHDCVKYKDGTGGCDGCLNWEGVDVHLEAVEYAKNFPNMDSGNNNGLGPIVRELERIYTETNYPHDGQWLAQSLRDSGKSRADLWSYAAIVAVEHGIETNNLACHNTTYPNMLWDSCVHEPNTDECFVRPSRPIQFQWGRADCTNYDLAFPYKALSPEKHANPTGDGKSLVQYFKDDFSFTGRETVAIMGAHTFGFPKIQNSLIPYTWTSRAVNLFNNDYYKSLTGQDRWFIDDNQCRRVGDAYGNKPKTRWVAHTRKMTKRGGPVFWIHQNHVCPSIYGHMNKFEQQCAADAQAGQQCRPDPPAGANRPRTADEADGNPHGGCEAWRLIVGRDEIALSCEMGLVFDFQVTDGVPHGCHGLEHFNASMQSDSPYSVWSQLPGQKGWSFSQPECGRQMIAEPAGSTPTSTIMEEYANDQTKWIDDFTLAFEKMMRNGYPNGLTNSADIHTNLVCPMPNLSGASDGICYILDKVGNGPAFMIGNRLGALSGKVYQYNPTSGKFDWAAITQMPNQLWRFSDSGSQLINEQTHQALIVGGVTSFKFENESNDNIRIVNPSNSNKVVDCWNAQHTGHPCIFWDRHGGHNQKFYQIPVSAFMIASPFGPLAGKVYQYNPSTGAYDWATKTGQPNQIWRFANNQSQLINESSGQPLSVSGVSAFNIEIQSNGIMYFINPSNNMVVDCNRARYEGQGCQFWWRHRGGNQKFYQIPV